MTSNICQRLLKKVWRSYANDLNEVPQTEGIYAIGDASETVLYVGHSNNMRRRLREHKSGTAQKINKFVNKKFKSKGETKLAIKWVETEDHKCEEGEYLDCIEKKLYWPRFNMKGGNRCN